MPTYRKKPVVIEARQWDGSQTSATKLIQWMGGAGKYIPSETINSQRFSPELHITTLEDGANGEAKHAASPNDFIIQGVRGEFYPCKPDVFEQTYEPAD